MVASPHHPEQAKRRLIKNSKQRRKGKGKNHPGEASGCPLPLLRELSLGH